jgi:hypothetical protein
LKSLFAMLSPFTVATESAGTLAEAEPPPQPAASAAMPARSMGTSRKRNFVMSIQ